jgi:hypothetical protein
VVVGTASQIQGKLEGMVANVVDTKVVPFDAE